jgi:hypothetical protein
MLIHRYRYVRSRANSWRSIQRVCANFVICLCSRRFQPNDILSASFIDLKISFYDKILLYDLLYQLYHGNSNYQQAHHDLKDDHYNVKDYHHNQDYDHLCRCLLCRQIRTVWWPGLEWSEMLPVGKHLQGFEPVLFSVLVDRFCGSCRPTEHEETCGRDSVTYTIVYRNRSTPLSLFVLPPP